MVSVSTWLLMALMAAPLPKELPKNPLAMHAKGGMQVDLKRRIGIAKGGVTIERNDVRVCCAQAEAHFEKRRIKKVRCEGSVVIVRPNGTRAYADLAVFDADRDQVVLEGKARVDSEQAQVEGKRIVYDIAQDRIEVRGQGSRFDFDPEGAKRKKGPPCPPMPKKAS